MLYTPNARQFLPEDTNGVEPSQTGFAIPITVGTAGAGYGAYTEIGYTCLEAAYGFMIAIRGTALTGNARRASINIAFGDAGAERVVVANLLCSSRGGDASNTPSMFIPLFVPPFTRISVNFSWTALVLTPVPVVTVDLQLITGSTSPDQVARCFQDCDTYGITSTTAPAGTAVTSVITAGAYGPDVSLNTNLLQKRYKAVLLVPGLEYTDNMGSTDFYIKLFIGSGDSSIIMRGCATTLATEYVIAPFPAFPVISNIPAGVNLNVAMATTGAGARTMDWAAYCFC